MRWKVDAEWQLLYPDAPGAPLGGDVEQFRAVASDASATAFRIREVQRQLRIYSGMTNIDFEGDAANAFIERSQVLTAGLAAAEPAFRDLAGIMRDHADRLEHQYDVASITFARARAHWKAKHEGLAAVSTAEDDLSDAEDDLESANASVTWWTAQLEGLTEDHGGYHYTKGKLEDAEDWVDDATSDVATATSAKKAAKDAVAEAEEGLRYEWNGRGHPSSWEKLRQWEDDLDNDTVERLKKIELGVLGDPSVVEAIGEKLSDAWDGLLEFGKAFMEDIQAFIEAIADGDLTAAIFALTEILDAVSLVLGVLSLIPALGPILGGVALALGGINAILKVGLAVTGAVDPRTGKRMGWVEAGLSVATFALAGTGKILKSDHGLLGRLSLKLAPDTVTLDNSKHLIDVGEFLITGTEVVIEGGKHAGDDAPTYDVDVTIPEPRSPEQIVGSADTAGDAIADFQGAADAPVDLFGANTPRLVGAAA